MDEMKKNTVTFKDVVYEVVDDPDYGFGLELDEIKTKAIEKKCSRMEFLALTLPMAIKILIPKAEKDFEIKFKEKKFLFKGERIGYCAMEQLNLDLIQAEDRILEEKLPTIYKKVHELKDKKDNEELVKNGQKAS